MRWFCRVRQATVWRMRFACWITKAIDAHWEYAIIIAFARQQRLYQLASMLRYTYSAWLVSSLCFHFVPSFCYVLVVRRFADYAAGVTDSAAGELCASPVRRWNCSSKLHVKIIDVVYTGCLQMNGAVQKLTRNLFLTLHERANCW